MESVVSQVTGGFAVDRRAVGYDMGFILRDRFAHGRRFPKEQTQLELRGSVFASAERNDRVPNAHGPRHRSG